MKKWRNIKWRKREKIRRELVVVQDAEEDVKEGREASVHSSEWVLRIERIIILLQPCLGNIQQMGLGDALGIDLRKSKKERNKSNSERGRYAGCIRYGIYGIHLAIGSNVILQIGINTWSTRGVEARVKLQPLLQVLFETREKLCCAGSDERKCF